jgi:hypothetical protein
MTSRPELTIDDLLSDPVALSLMRADHVDPIELHGILRVLALRLRSRRFHPFGRPF